MPDYFVFGGCLRSELTFPALTQAHGLTPNWMLRLGTLSRSDDAEVLSDVELSPTCRIRLTRGDGWFRYSHSCTGSFEVFAEGRRIIFEPSKRGDLDGARADFISRVLLYCLDHSSTTLLHGSAVRVGGGALAFLGPSGSGKSTLALALTRGGAHHICDDILPVEAGTKPMVWSSDDIIRLCSDSRSHLASSANVIRRESDGKFVIAKREAGSTQSAFAADRPSARSQLDAIYVLNPSNSSDGTAAARRRLVSPTSAVAILTQHLKLGPVVGREDRIRLVRQLGAIVRAVPVYELSVLRDWARVEEVIDCVIGWHAPVASPQTRLISA
jgi:hypothetical protein